MALPAETSRDIWHRPIDRRQLLSKGSLAIGGVMFLVDAGYIVAQAIAASKQEPSYPEVDSEYGQLVEERYGIKLTQQPNAVWTDKRVLIIGENLSHLPAVMYAPRGDKQLDIELQAAPPGQEQICCTGSYDTYSSKIHLRADDVTTKYLPFEVDMNTHELGHYRTFSLGRVPQELLQQSIGENFSVFSADVSNMMSQEFSRLPVFQTADTSAQHILRRLHYGIINPDELIAVLGEIYTWGKDSFSQISEWVGEVRAQEFYDIVKTQMFGGKEYVNHSEVEGKLKFDSKGKPIQVGFLGIDKTKKPTR